MGSAVIYKKLADIIKIAYSEIEPIELAEYSKYFSKSSESLKGGFGIYNLTEKVIMDRMKEFSFN